MAEARELPVVILTTAADPREADTMARSLVEERLAACVSQVSGVKSFFHWESRVESATESLLLVKTLVTLAPRVTARIKELSAYDVPEILVLPVAAGNGPYLDWMRGELKGENEGHDAAEDHHTDY